MAPPSRNVTGNFSDKLSKAIQSNNSLLCVGLDPDPRLMPATDVISFNRAIIEATADLVCAYKPNLAFYEALGAAGPEALAETISAVPAEIPIIGDAKRGDVGHTAGMYARALFDYYQFDAVTVNPYLGLDSLEPFLAYRERGVFVLCKTSNAGSQDFQALPAGPEGLPLYEIVARRLAEYENNNLGLVVGATFPQELKRVRQLCPDMLLLVPGVGTQGGDLGWAVVEGIDRNGGRVIINSSRQVLYASRDTDFASRAREEARRLRDEINGYRKTAVAGR